MNGDMIPQHILATLNNKYNGWHNQTNLSLVKKIEIIYFRCTTNVSLTLTKEKTLKSVCCKSYSKHLMQFCSFYFVSRVPDGDALHKNA